MAKAREIPELNCSDEAVEGAAQVLRTRFDEVIERRTAALDFSDIKGVHDMRVAARRLRSALRDFMPLLKKSLLKPTKTDLKNLADALGKVRDLDVEITALEKLQAEIAPENIKSGIENFLHERRELREPARLDLTEILTPEKVNKLKEQFTASLEQAVDAYKFDSTVSFKDFGREIITTNLQEFGDLSPALYEPFNSCNLHKLRICAKRLRYAMQLFAICWDQEMKQFAKEISKLQSFLGNTHDYDVWIENLGVRLNKSINECNRQTTIRLLAEFLEQRNKDYISAVRLHNEWKTTYFISRLKALML